MSTRTPFEKEAKGSSGMAYCFTLNAMEHNFDLQELKGHLNHQGREGLNFPLRNGSISTLSELHLRSWTHLFVVTTDTPGVTVLARASMRELR